MASDNAQHLQMPASINTAFIGGDWRPGAAGLFAVENPSDRSIIASVSNCGPSDATHAVDAACSAFNLWRRLSPRNRGEILRSAYELIIRETDSLADLISAENGKSLADARGEVAYAAEFFRWYAEEAVRTRGDYGPAPTGDSRSIVTHRPVGVAALITPWNFPAAMVARKIAPALAAGCTVVLKPAAETPLTALALAQLLAQAGVPAGVVNVVPTTDAEGIATRLLSDSRVKKLSFTGSTRVGSILLRQAADRIVNSSMELGGNAPFVVADDADLESAVAGAMIAKFRNGGQACTAANRFYVHANISEEFVWQFGNAIERLTVGDARTGAAIGPMISRNAVTRLEEVVVEAVTAGAKITHQARVPICDGYFYPPTLLTRVAPEASILQHELFGPVAPVVTWSDDTELVELINGTDMGLASYIYTADLQRALRLGEATEAGMVGINRGLVSDPSAPFGGMKQSGLGREGARHGLEEFQETQYLSVAWP